MMIAILGLLSVAAFLFGLVVTIYPIRALGFTRRLEGVAVTAAAFGLFLFAASNSPDNKTQTALAAQAPKAIAAEQPRALTKKEMLDKIQINGFRWEKTGFGTVMEATFVIYNNNPMPVKDVVISCRHLANSGTQVDSVSRTVYEYIAAGGYHAVPKINLGFIHSATSESQCRVTNFTAA